MDTVNIPSSNVPVELKACEQILKRATELKKAEPVVAYWCTLRRTLFLFDSRSDPYRLLLCCSKGIEDAKPVSRGY